MHAGFGLLASLPSIISTTDACVDGLAALLLQVKQALHTRVSRSFTEYRAIAGESFIDPKRLTKVRNMRPMLHFGWTCTNA